MKLSTAAELALRGATVLAENHGTTPTRLYDICAARDLPRDYMAKILGSLARADLVVPIRGKKGGYRLSRDPASITALEVIEAIEGPMVLNLCQHDPPQCQRCDCVLRQVWADAQEFIRNRLRSLTLADCARGATISAD